MVDISIIIPGIRPDRWWNIYESIKKSTKRNFELIICGPYNPPEEFRNIKNFKYIKDWGSPVRASCIAFDVSEGDLITWSADDALFFEGALDKYIDEQNAFGGIICGKYIEGANGTNKVIQPNSYFTLNGSTWTNSSHFRDDWYLFNVGVIPKAIFNYLGGWDCSYEVAFYSYTDMAATAYLKNIPVKFIETLLLDCDHMPASTGDHGPIELAQTHYDLPLFKSRYAAYVMPQIFRKSWRESPNVWSKRFHD